jgi:hypothetical protein
MFFILIIIITPNLLCFLKIFFAILIYLVKQFIIFRMIGPNIVTCAKNSAPSQEEVIDDDSEDRFEAYLSAKADIFTPPVRYVYNPRTNFREHYYHPYFGFTFSCNNLILYRDGSQVALKRKIAKIYPTPSLNVLRIDMALRILQTSRSNKLKLVLSRHEVCSYQVNILPGSDEYGECTNIKTLNEEDEYYMTAGALYVMLHGHIGNVCDYNQANNNSSGVWDVSLKS